MTTTDLPSMLEALTAIGCEPRRRGGSWSLRCPHPAHHDDTPSATIKAGNSQPWVLNCFGCAPPASSNGERSTWVREIVERVESGEPLAAANPSARNGSGGSGQDQGHPVAAYDYADADGTVRARKIRYENEDGRKTFGWVRPFGDGWVAGLGAGGSMALLPMYGLTSLAKPGPVYVVEGEKDADRLHALGLPAISSAGGANANPESVTLPTDLTRISGRTVVVVPDRDEAGQGYAEAWSRALTGVAGSVRTLVVPIDVKGADVSDLLDSEGDDAFMDWIADAPIVATSLDEAHAIFRKWMGEEYDTDALDAVLATLAVERMDGDPVWLLLISGSGNAKTETVIACSTGALIAGTIASAGALLSGTARKEQAKDATGGLLRQLEPRGVLVIKDVTSILSMNREARNEVLGALREVHDGEWSREVGTDGGKRLHWSGRIAVVGAVTTAWDTAHTAIAALGDRFVLLRSDSRVGRTAAGRMAISNTGSETLMRADLRNAATGVLAGMSHAPVHVTVDELDTLLAAADLVTLARTAVDFAYNGDVIDAHAPEMPTRFAKELAQVLRGGIAIGMTREDALRLAIRCARDSMPPLRLLIVDYLAEHPGATTSDVRRGVDKPRTTIDRQLQALHMLGVVDVEEEAYGGGSKSRWRYSLADGIDVGALKLSRNVQGGVYADASQTGSLLRVREVPTFLGKISGSSGSEVDEAQPVTCDGCGEPLTPTADSPTSHPNPECERLAAERKAARDEF